MKFVLIPFLFLALLATPVSASNFSHSFEMTHYMEAHINGEWTFNHELQTPAQGSHTIELDGVGEAMLKSQLHIIEQTKTSPRWFDLF